MGYFSVQMRRKEVVAAVLPVQERGLPQSNLDLLLPPLDVGVFFCYKKPSPSSGSELLSTFASMVDVLKRAMSQVLVSYYAFAGELVQNGAGEPELLCNNRGVDFFEAFADIELRHLNLYNPDESIEGKLVPQKMHGVLSVQVTELKCGGLVVACTFDHRVADAYSANMFLVSWAEMAQSKPLSFLPSFQRSLLSPRRPGRYDSALDSIYAPISSLSPPKPCTAAADQLISRIYLVEADQLSQLQSLASCGGGRRKTKLESFCAYLWKLVAAAENGSGSSRTCKMGLVVDGRARLGEGDPEKADMMTVYFGNVLSIPFGEARVGELEERPLSWAAEAVRDFLEKAATKSHFEELIDWVEAHRPEAARVKIYGGGEGAGPAFVVSSGQRFPVTKVDFGWGKAVFGSYHFPWGGEAGYVMPMASPDEKGGWVVYVHLQRRQVEVIETAAPHFFKPVTCDFLSPI